MEADSRHFADGPVRSLAAGLFALALGSLGPILDSSQLVQPIRSPSPVYFNVTTDPRSVKPGGTARITVTLQLNNRPKSGADVHLDMVFTPGEDYRLKPDSGTTDASGTFAAIVKVSTMPGYSVIAASSGVFSDQAQVTAIGPAGNPAGVAKNAGRDASSGASAVVPILVAVAAGLVGSLGYLRIRSRRRA